MHTLPSLEGCIAFIMQVGLLAFPISDGLPMVPMGTTVT